MNSGTDRNRTQARRFMEHLVNTCAVDELSTFASPDYEAHHLPIRGLDGMREHLLTFHRVYPDLRAVVDGQIAEGDIVVTWWTMRGTHLGEFAGVKPSGQTIVLKGVNVQRFRDGLIVEQWGGSNSLEALLSIGALRWNVQA
jgi:steroid delta-isomerase-like uncharacterized protein